MWDLGFEVQGLGAMYQDPPCTLNYDRRAMGPFWRVIRSE